MALNGLDAVALQHAFEAASAEAGWYVADSMTKFFTFIFFLTCVLRDFRFMMKYSSRDDIELLGTGGSSVREMRELAYTEPNDSPLYAFVRYRRRNILIKLVPEGTSRVLKGELDQLNYSVHKFY